ncbi:MAG: tetratricopeptide repeat protein, partial [Gammaproteobacteria bacterium]
MIDPSVIRQLKQHLRNRDAEKAYSLGLTLLAREPDGEFLSYATAWGAARTGRPAEVPALITPAIAANPENFNYRSLRGQAYLELARFNDALADFETMARLRPESPSAWNNLRRIAVALNLNYPLPRNLTMVIADTADAYGDRQWPRCGELLGELRELDPLVAEYWELLIADYRLQLRDPLASWRTFHLRARATVEADRAESSQSMTVLVRRDLPAKALFGAIKQLIKQGDLSEVLAELRNLEKLYGQICPLLHVPGICGLFIRHQSFAECLEFLDELESATPAGEAKATFGLRVFPYRQICRTPLPGDGKSNPLSDSTMTELCRAFIPGSRQARAACACEEFSAAIQASDARVLADVRFDAGQVHTLRTRIVDAVVQRTALALLRIGDADCYGFRDDGIESFSDRFSGYWWGKIVSAPVRH